MPRLFSPVQKATTSFGSSMGHWVTYRAALAALKKVVKDKNRMAKNTFMNLFVKRFLQNICRSRMKNLPLCFMVKGNGIKKEIPQAESPYSV